MSQSKVRKTTGTKNVCSRNEINLKLHNSASRGQDSHASTNIISQTSKCNPCKSNFIYTCSGCNKPIKRDKYLLKACDKYWHENCLKCDRCHSRLGELGSTLYCKSNMNLCRQDYLEMFGQTGVCSLCEKLICASEMVMRAKQNVYHLECFACQLCSQRFCVGDRFYLCENKVVCQYDYEEHILPIQQSMIEQTAGPLYQSLTTPIQVSTSSLQLESVKPDLSGDDQMKEVITMQEPREESFCAPEVDLANLDAGVILKDADTQEKEDSGAREKFNTNQESDMTISNEKVVKYENLSAATEV